MYMFSCKENYMAEERTSILLSDVSIEGDLIEKDKIILDAKISGNIKAEFIETHPNSNITGNISSKDASIINKIYNALGYLCQWEWLSISICHTQYN